MVKTKTKFINIFEEIDFDNIGMRCRNGVNTIEQDVCIPNDIFNRINVMPLKSDIHKSLVFSFYVTLLISNSFDNMNSFLNYKHIAVNDDFFGSYIDLAIHEKFEQIHGKKIYYYEQDVNVKDMLVSNTQLKELWHYSPQFKEIDYIIKQNGAMDKAGLTEFLKRGYKHIAYRAELQKGNYFRIPSMLIWYFTGSDTLDSTAFTIYCLISKMIQLKKSPKGGVDLTYEYFKHVLDVANDTIRKALLRLEEDNLIEVERTNVEDDYGDFIQRATNRYRLTHLDFVSKYPWE